MPISRITLPLSVLLGCVLAIGCTLPAYGESRTNDDAGPRPPRIVNIINFVRLLEPRSAEITKEVLYQTVVEQIRVMRTYKLRGTFLLQYDALMDPRYQQLMTCLPRDTFEIGAWWEIPQPLVEHAGLQWRGRYPWDWHADVGFSTGYTPAEREKLADVYMQDFKKIFGYYPASVGSWFIDAHTLNYLYDKYKITASCNCKDQYGTDGYTLWGGYWTQAYYPSRVNSYMPAQNAENQLSVPVFRMLGSDPIRQYDQDRGSNGQGVITLEPVYPFGGGDSAWVHWYFKAFIEGTVLGFMYAQTGQENSFTWNAMSKGFMIQMPLIAKLRDEHRLQVETLAESGKWFRDHYVITPATCVTVKHDIDGSDRKTVWFNSRFYRVSILWEKARARVRDIHLFDERFPSRYTTGKATSNDCAFFTLPVVEGYLWSSKEEIAGMQLKALTEGGEAILEGFDPEFSEPEPGALHISWPLKNFKGTLLIDMDEKRIRMELEGARHLSWHIELHAAPHTSLPFTNIGEKVVNCRFEGMGYSFHAEKGSFVRSSGETVFRLVPESNVIILNLAER